MTSWREAEEIFRQIDPNFSAWKDTQSAAYDQWEEQQLRRMLLFFPTGEGKTKTSLALMAARGYQELIVIAPPKTHRSWEVDAAALGIKLRLDSIQKFRAPDTKYPRGVPIIADEFHQFGGHTGKGWKKLNRMAANSNVPIIISSATPEYNDAERVFCIINICDENPERNFLSWLYATCVTEANFFSAIPDVVGFKEYPSSLEFLKARPYTAYIEDTATWTPDDLWLPLHTDTVFEEYGYDEQIHRIMNSDMEARHRRVNKQFIAEDGFIHEDIMDCLTVLGNYPGRFKWLIFCNHKTVAEALHRTLSEQFQGGMPSWIISGDTTKEQLRVWKKEFVEAEEGWFIGTTALATGVDGIDKVCQSMLILDDLVGDPSLRRQLIGRILPRGTDDGIERIVLTARFSDQSV